MADILLRGLILPSKKSSRAAQHAAGALSRRGQDHPRVVLREGVRDWVSLLAGARSAVGGVELELPERHRCGGVAMRYAVDTNVVSELMRPHPDSAIESLMVASIALRNDAMLATRNTLDFDYLDIPLENPFERHANAQGGAASVKGEAAARAPRQRGGRALSPGRRLFSLRS